MATSLYDLSVPTFLQTVKAVGDFLDRAARHCSETRADPDDFVHARLFDDMAPFYFQIEAAWHHSVWGLAAEASLHVGDPDPFVFSAQLLFPRRHRIRHLAHARCAARKARLRGSASHSDCLEHPRGPESDPIRPSVISTTMVQHHVKKPIGEFSLTLASMSAIFYLSVN